MGASSLLSMRRENLGGIGNPLGVTVPALRDARERELQRGTEIGLAEKFVRTRATEVVRGFLEATVATHYSTPCTVMSPMVSFCASSRSISNLFLESSLSFLQMFALLSPSGRSPQKNGKRCRDEKTFFALGKAMAMEAPPFAR